MNVTHEPYPVVTSCGHERKLFQVDTFKEALDFLLASVTPYEQDFDAIAVSGYSSAMIVPALALKLNKNSVLVRKDSEERNSSYKTEGVHNQRVLFVDDLVSTGDTFERVYKGLQRIGCKIVGYALYENRGESDWLACEYRDVEHYRSN